MSLKVIRQSRIERKLLMNTILFGFFITLGITAVQFYLDYRKGIEEIHNYMEMIESSYLESLTHSLWVYDDEQVQVQLNGILGLPGMAFVEIRHGEKTIASAGKLISKSTIERTFGLTHNEYNQKIELGTLRVANDLGRVLRQLRGRAVMIFAGNTALFFLISGFFLLLFHSLVTRRLIELADRLSGIHIELQNENAEQENSEADFEKHDEMERVIIASDTMQTRISNAYEALRKSEERYRKLISQMPAGFALHEMIYDDSGRPEDYRFLEVNAAFEELTGVPTANVVGKTVLDVMPGTENYWIDVFGQVSLTGQPTRIENYSKEIGKFFDVVTYSPVQNQFAVIFTDISDRKNLEKAQQQQRDVLESKVKERTDELRQRVEESERLNRAMINLLDDLQDSNKQLKSLSSHLTDANKELEAFTYSVSHDLRAPLRGIDGFSKIVLEDYADQLDEHGRDCLNRVRSAARRMGILIDDLLRLSRVSRAELNQVPVDISAMAEDIAGRFQEDTPDRKTEVKIEKGVRGIADPNLLHIVLENLISNAFKFTAKRTNTRIGFSCDHDGKETVFRVRDNGAGFDMRYAGQLFGAFQRLHDVDEFKGNGIGLSIVKRIIQRHGGRVWAEGVVGQGATFYFTLQSEEEQQ